MKLRYAIATKEQALISKLNVKTMFNYHPVYNACHDQFLPVIANSNHYEVNQFRWGLQLHSESKKFYDISVENIFQHWKVTRKLRVPLLRIVREQRCIILANCFIVWKDKDFPFCVYGPNQRLFGLAGIWHRDFKDPSVFTFSILTQPSNRFLKKLCQDRMPLIISEHQYKRWTKGQLSYSNITQVLREVFPSDELNAYPVRKEIENPENNFVDILKPAGQRIKEESDHLIKEKLVPLGWGRSRPENESDPLWKQMGLDHENETPGG